MIGDMFMDSTIISLRDYINNRDLYKNIKIQTFCRLMKKVSETIDCVDKSIIKINIDDIKININSGQIILPDYIFSENNLDKTISGFNTGISLMADRKSTNEHKRVAFALMLLGWYVNEDNSSVNSDMTVLENFDEYMNKVPNWLKNYFVSVFKNMNYNLSFSDYYKTNFIDVINKKIEDTFKEYNLSKENMDKVKYIISKETNKLMKGEFINE